MEIKINKSHGISTCKIIEGGTTIDIDFDSIDYEDLINLSEEVAHFQGDYRRGTSRLIQAIEFLNENEK